MPEPWWIHLQVRSVDVIRVDLVSALLPRLRNNVDVLVCGLPVLCCRNLFIQLL